MNHAYISSGRVSSVVDDLLERIRDQLGVHGWTSMPRRSGAGTTASPPSCPHRTGLFDLAKKSSPVDGPLEVPKVHDRVASHNLECRTKNKGPKVNFFLIEKARPFFCVYFIKALAFILFDTLPKNFMPPLYFYFFN